MALTNWGDILNKPKGIDQIEEIALEVSDLSASVLTVKAGVETLNDYETIQSILPSGITTVFVKCGNICSIHFGDGSTNADFAANSIIGTVPAGFEPQDTVDYRDVGSSKRIIINTDGTIIARDSMPTGTLVRGYITYIKKEPTTQATRQAKKTTKKK